MRKVIFFIILLILVAVASATIFKTIPISLLGNKLYLAKFIEKIAGLTGFILLFIEIILGAFPKWSEKIFGRKTTSTHVAIGIIAYLLIFLHPLFLMFVNKFARGEWTPYTYFVDACFICDKPYMYYFSIGIISFWLLTITSIAGLYRSNSAWFKTNWRKIHVVNYVIFLLVAVHGFLLGSDFKTMPLFALAIIMTLTILGISILIELPRLYKNFRNWVNS